MKIGVIGGGQLGRMMALSGVPLGQQFVFLDPAADACAGQVGGLIQSAYDDPENIQTLVDQVDLVTFEFESVPPQTVETISQQRPVFPNASSLATARDRWFEKTLFQQQGIPTAPIAKIDDQASLEKAVADIGLPAVLKTRTLGYDGKGQKVLRSDTDVVGAFEELGSVPMILEGFINFDAELSCIGVRGRNGETRFYPLVENEHRQGILHRSIPTDNHPLQVKAEDYVASVMSELDYVGVITFEFFQRGDELIANEIAPRVHNSGHWTIEGSETSQFENHVRAIAGLPLGRTERLGYVAMYNLIGVLPDREAVLAIEGAKLHDYAKSEKPGRKIGHITVNTRDKNVYEQALMALDQLINNQLG